VIDISVKRRICLLQSEHCRETEYHRRTHRYDELLFDSQPHVYAIDSVYFLAKYLLKQQLSYHMEKIDTNKNNERVII